MENFKLFKTLINFKLDLAKLGNVKINLKIDENITEEFNKIKEKYSSAKLRNYYNVYKKFIDCFNKKIFNLTRLDLKKICWMLNYSEKYEPYNVKILENEEYLNKCIELISEKFSSSMIIPLTYNHLNSWKNQKKKLSEFLLRKVHEYNGKNFYIKNIQKFKYFFFHEDGDAKYINNYSVKLNSEIFDKTNFPDYFYQTQFFASLIIKYTEKIIKRNQLNLETIEDITNFLKIHNNLDTTKIVISKIIIELGTDADLQLKDFLRNFVLQEIGDPLYTSQWRLSSKYNLEENELLEKARKIFKIWLTVDTINLFFDRLSHTVDPHGFVYRKAFWKTYAEYMENFKIIGPDYLKEELILNDEKIKELIEKRYAFLRGAEENQCAFVFQIKGYTFVEFAKTGSALYVYAQNSQDIPNFQQNVFRIDELKTSRFYNAYLIRKRETYWALYNEGRLIHFNSESYRWQNLLKSWFEKILDINTDKSFRI